jgi:alpha-glucosidase
VPLPWTSSGSSFGFGSGSAHLPQPAWFAGLAVSAQQTDPDSTLNWYRRVLTERRRLAARGTNEFEWLPSPAGSTHFSRGSWRCFTNFADVAVRVPDGQVILSSGSLTDGQVPPATTVYLA